MAIRLKTPREFFEEVASHTVFTSYLWDFSDFSDPMIEEAVREVLRQSYKLNSGKKLPPVTSGTIW